MRALISAFFTRPSGLLTAQPFILVSGTAPPENDDENVPDRIDGGGGRVDDVSVSGVGWRAGSSVQPDDDLRADAEGWLATVWKRRAGGRHQHRVSQRGRGRDYGT